MDSSRSYLDQTVRLHVLSQAGASPRRRSPGGGGAARAYRRHRGCLSSSGLGDLGNSNNSATILPPCNHNSRSETRSRSRFQQQFAPTRFLAASVASCTLVLHSLHLVG
jgi:hypothetical protein